MSSYAPTNWQDYPSLATAISAARLNNMESGIQAAYRVGTGGLTNADIANGAAIAYSKLALTGQIVNADIAAAAAISYSKLQLAAAILNSDIANAAAIDLHKLNIPNDATKVALGDGTWGAPPAGGGTAGAQLDYAQITASVTGVTASTEATAVTLVSGNSVTYDGSKVKVEVYVPAVAAATSLWYYRVLLLRDTTVIGYAAGKSVGGDAANGFEFYAAAFDTPAAGAHTYKASAYVQASTNFSFLAGAGGSGNLLPAFLRVTKA